MKKKNIKKKAILIPVVLIVLALVGGGIVALSREKATKEEPQPEVEPQKKRISMPTNVIDPAEAPYLKLVPLSGGRNVEIVVNNVKKPAKLMEYELEYQSGSLLQGAFGEIELEDLPSKTKILLGSCSAGGACTYHEDVKGGTLLAIFIGEDDYALKQGWRYFENQDGSTEFGSRDAKFLIKSDDLTSNRYLIIYNSYGYPGELPGELKSQVYTLATSGSLTGEAEVSLKANEATDNLILVGYDGEDWIEFKSTIDDKTVTATADLVEAYAVVAK